MAAKKNALVANTTVELAPSELRLYQRNPRKGNVGAVAASLKAHGQYRPIVANIGTHTGRRLEVLAGNHTLKAFRTLAQRDPGDPAWSRIQVFLVDVDDDQARRIVLADNKTSEGGGYDNDALAGILTELQDSDSGLGAVGFTADDLDALSGFDEGGLPPLDDDDLIDSDDLPPDPGEGGGRGAPVISYSIVFDTTEEKAAWVEFMNWLKRRHPDLTVGERIVAYIEGRHVIEGEAEFDGP